MKRLLAASFVVIAVGCSGSPPPEPGLQHREPTPLVHPFASYQSVEQARNAVPDAEWIVVEDSRAPARGRCPRFDAYTISTRGSQRGHTGELRLNFINGVLYQSAFYPDDAEAYVETLAAIGHPFPDRDSIGAPMETRPPRTKLWHWEAYDGRRYVGWSDEAIAEEIDAWISVCS